MVHVVVRTIDKWQHDIGWKTRQTDRQERSHKAFFDYAKAYRISNNRHTSHKQRHSLCHPSSPFL